MALTLSGHELVELQVGSDVDGRLIFLTRCPANDATVGVRIFIPIKVPNPRRAGHSDIWVSLLFARLVRLTAVASNMEGDQLFPPHQKYHARFRVRCLKGHWLLRRSR